MPFPQLNFSLGAKENLQSTEKETLDQKYQSSCVYAKNISHTHPLKVKGECQLAISCSARSSSRGCFLLFFWGGMHLLCSLSRPSDPEVILISGSSGGSSSCLHESTFLSCNSPQSSSQLSRRIVSEVLLPASGTQRRSDWSRWDQCCSARVEWHHSHGWFGLTGGCVQVEAACMPVNNSSEAS